MLTPAKLYNNWDSYRDNDYSDNPLSDDNIRYKVLCHTDLSRYSGTSRSGIDLERFDWSRFDLIVIDESHNFRNRVEKEESETRYQRLLETVVKATPHKVRLTTLHVINLHISRHFAQKFLDIRQYAFKISIQSDEKSDCVSDAQSLCGIALRRKTGLKCSCYQQLL